MKKISKNKNLQKFIHITLVILLVIVIYPRFTSAAALTALSDTMTRLKVSTLSSHDILFTMASGNTFAAGETITVDFKEDAPESDFSVNGAASVVADFDFSNDGAERVIYNVGATTDCTGSVGVNDISVGIDDTTGIVTFLACPSFTASPATAIINIEYGTAAAGGTDRVTNPSAQTVVIDIGGTFGDSGKLAVVIIADDQVVLDATVDPSITFSLSANSSNFGPLSTGSVVQGATDVKDRIAFGGLQLIEPTARRE